MTNVNHSLSNLVVGYHNNNRVGVIWKRINVAWIRNLQEILNFDPFFCRFKSFQKTVLSNRILMKEE